MGAVKRTKQDVVFSNYIRERDKWCCQRCGKAYNKHDSNARRALHCSHFHGRGKWSVRFDPDNATALCYGCHRIMGSQPMEHLQFFKKRLGKNKFLELQERANKPSKKRNFLNDHFLNELNLMLEEISE